MDGLAELGCEEDGKEAAGGRVPAADVPRQRRRHPLPASTGSVKQTSRSNSPIRPGQPHLNVRRKRRAPVTTRVVRKSSSAFGLAFFKDLPSSVNSLRRVSAKTEVLGDSRSRHNGGQAAEGAT